MESQKRHCIKNVGHVSENISLLDWEALLFANISARKLASLHMCSMRTSQGLARSHLQFRIKLANSGRRPIANYPHDFYFLAIPLAPDSPEFPWELPSAVLIVTNGCVAGAHDIWMLFGFWGEGEGIELKKKNFVAWSMAFCLIICWTLWTSLQCELVEWWGLVVWSWEGGPWTWREWEIWSCSLGWREVHWGWDCWSWYAGGESESRELGRL